MSNQGWSNRLYKLQWTQIREVTDKILGFTLSTLHGWYHRTIKKKMISKAKPQQTSHPCHSWGRSSQNSQESMALMRQSQNHGCHGQKEGVRFMVIHLMLGILRMALQNYTVQIAVNRIHDHPPIWALRPRIEHGTYIIHIILYIYIYKLSLTCFYETVATPSQNTRALPLVQQDATCDLGRLSGAPKGFSLPTMFGVQPSPHM